EFENVSSVALEAAAGVTLVRPGPNVLHVTQNRGREKAFLAHHGLPITPHLTVTEPGGLDKAVAAIGVPCVVKTAGFGYDGKGQAVLRRRDDEPAWSTAIGLADAGPVVVESLVDLDLELSVVAARTATGDVVAYAPFVNRHVDQVLDVSLTPELIEGSPSATDEAVGTEPRLRLPRSVADQARELAIEVFERLDLVGLGCVEFFLSRSGELLIDRKSTRLN